MNKALFWDFDKTLAHSHSIWTNAVFSAVAEIAAVTAPDGDVTVFTADDVRPHLRTGFTWHDPDGDYTAVTGQLWWERMFRQFSSVYQALGVNAAAADAASRRTREYILTPEHYTVYDDTLSTLEALRSAGFRHYLLSNNYPELEDILDALGLSPYFSGCIVSARVGYDKPRPEIFRLGLEIAGEPDISYMIGDNPYADIGGAKAAGLPAILVHNQADCGADFVCENLCEIPEHIL